VDYPTDDVVNAQEEDQEASELFSILFELAHGIPVHATPHGVKCFFCLVPQPMNYTDHKESCIWRRARRFIFNRGPNEGNQ
jgi:hypothetical protein